MSMVPAGSGRFEDLALAVYLEEVGRARRVLWVGDSSTRAPDRLAASARSVLVLDPREQPAVRREGGLRVSLLRPGPLQFRPSSFELAVVPDLGVFDAAAGDRLDDLRESVGDEGLVAVAVQAKEGSFDVFHGLIAERFPSVRWVGQAPFVGVAVADFEPALDDDVVIDGSLVDEEGNGPAPRRYVALCSASPRSAVPYTVVQCPGGGLAEPASNRPVPKEAADAVRLRGEQARLEEQRAEAEQAHAHAEELGALLAARDRRLRELEEALADARREVSRSEDEPSGDRVAERRFETEYDELERTLAGRARDLLELRREVERRGVLVRDLVQENVELRRESWAAAGAAGGPFGAPGSDAERERVIERALEAEARWAEARFRADELEARLASFGRPPSEPAASSPVEADHALEGTVRGLRSRVAELEEMRELAEGRVELANIELDAASQRCRGLERELGELQERFELELVRSRGPAGGSTDTARLRQLESTERELAAQVGELTGQLVVCREHAEMLAAERDRARAEALKLTSYVATVEDRLEGMRLGYERRIAELLEDGARGSAGGANDLVLLSAELYGLRGERDGLLARLRDREAALAAQAGASSSVETDDQRFGRVADELDAARERVESLETQHDTLTSRLIEVEERAARQAERAADLTSAMAARDALVTRLQMDLAEQEQVTRSCQEQADRLLVDNQRMRDGLVEASQAVDERDRLAAQLEELGPELERHRALAAELEQETGSARRRLDQLEGAHGGALETLGDLRRLLVELPWPDPQAAPAHEITAVGMEAPSGPGGANAPAEVPERVAELERILQERDEQVRSLERRLEAERAPDAYAEALQREMMEMQERVARLSEELEHERAARRAAESQPPQSPAERDAEMRRLQSMLGDRSAEVEKMRGRVATFERDVHAMRKTCADARHGLEELLGAATASGDPSTAERIGSLLRLLGRF